MEIARAASTQEFNFQLGTAAQKFSQDLEFT